LGGLLGLLARRPILRPTVDVLACNECGQCRIDCQGAAMREQPEQWQPSECFMCLNCQARCNQGAIRFGLGSPLERPSNVPLDFGKRAALVAGGVGVASMLALRLTPEAQARVYNPGLIRPPGSRPERDFIDRCIRCGICARVCPADNITVADRVVFGDRCQNCFACLHACPRGALHLKSERSERRWRNPQTPLGELIRANSGALPDSVR